MPAFQPTEYLRPSTPEETASVLAKLGDAARIIGGGTQIYELAERGLLSEITTLVDLSRLGLNRIERDGTELRIGAGVTLSQLEQVGDIASRPSLGAITDSVRSIHPIQVKNLATVGGALCSSISFFDLPVGLAAVDGTVQVVGGGGSTRERPVAEFMVDFLTADLNTGEFVTGITVEQNEFTSSAFAKFSLTGNDWAMVNCGCSLRIEKGSIASARVVFGGVSGGLLSASETAEKLHGLAAKPGPQFEGAIDALDRELKDAMSDYKASGDYRRRLAKVLLREALARAVAREKG